MRNLTARPTPVPHSVPGGLMLDTYLTGALVLGNDAITADIWSGSDGEDRAVIRIGHQLTVHVADASAETLDRLAQAATEVAAWKRRSGLKVAS
ncbi:hypothetical protein AB0O20_06790 [Streptomyces kronopolitis]|uniref:hypothetical protein n=1 Tax=Streptomyces kronopolitis TaxID=1612435 RepID=UPI0034492954